MTGKLAESDRLSQLSVLCIRFNKTELAGGKHQYRVSHTVIYRRYDNGEDAPHQFITGIKKPSKEGFVCNKRI